MADYRLFLIGDNAVAIEPADREERHPLAAALRKANRWIDVVPGKEVVAVQFDPLDLLPSEAEAKVRAWLADFHAEENPAGETVDLHLDVSPDHAPDLERLADSNGLSSQAFLERILASDLRVDMLGFTPGFAYVEGVDAGLKSERLSIPRQRVAAGAVGMVWAFTGLPAPAAGRLSES